MNELDAQMMAILVCPACKGDLLSVDGGLVCNPCCLKFKIIDGIPVLLVTEAERVMPDRTFSVA